MKYVRIALLSVCLVFMCACGNEGRENENPSGSNLPTPTATNMPTPTVTAAPTPTNMPTPTPTNPPTPTPAEGSIRVELELASDCFTYGEYKNDLETEYKFVCTGLSEKGYAEFKKYGSSYLVSINLPGKSDTGKEVSGFHSDSAGGYDLTELLSENSAYVELVCADSYSIYYGINDNLPKEEYIHKLVNVVLNEGLDKIGTAAFYRCRGIETVMIPDTVKEVDYNAFAQCTGLINVTIGGSVEQLNDCAFMDCTGLTEVKLPDSLKELWNSVFMNCTSLERVTLGKNITWFGGGAFMNCEKLVFDTFELGGKRFGCDVFSGVRINTLTLSTDDVETDEYGTLRNADIGEVVIAEGVERIEDYTFKRSNVEEIVLPDTVTTICWEAFADCKNLKEIEIPESVTKIGENVFVNCDKLVIFTPSGSYAEGYAIINGISIKKKN